MRYTEVSAQVGAFAIHPFSIETGKDDPITMIHEVCRMKLAFILSLLILTVDAIVALWRLPSQKWLVLVQILLSVCFYLARSFADFKRPGPRPKFAERWLLLWLVV